MQQQQLLEMQMWQHQQQQQQILMSPGRNDINDPQMEAYLRQNQLPQGHVTTQIQYDSGDQYDPQQMREADGMLRQPPQELQFSMEDTFQGPQEQQGWGRGSEYGGR